ncbi:AraC family transcriptional regulator [Puia sp.]|uniref:AraC family transcriptional regulator n=1 Tax=Puia sp. TaxID=2045100 RepID=UPI002F4182F3
MRPQLLKVSREPGHSFSVRRDLVPYINNKWHFHAEVELIHFKQGRGTQFVGDNMKRFKAGDVVLVGANLPHYWRFDDPYFDEHHEEPTDVRVAHFPENFWGGSFLDLPENTLLKALLEKARRGLQVEGEARDSVAHLLEKLLDSEGMTRVILLMEALQVLAQSDQVQPLASMGFQHTLGEAEHLRINLIYEYSLRHFRRPIQLEEIAAVANISPNSFCRFFKSRTRKTYSRFLLELRVGHACKLLIENNLSIKQLCYESGFNNFTSFYKYFKLITGKSPLGYQRARAAGGCPTEGQILARPNRANC